MTDLKVVFLSNWKDNPYKKLLSNHLNQLGVKIEEYLWDYFFLPLFLPLVIQKGKFDILHFHTLHPFLIGKNIISQLIKVFVFVSQLFILNLLGTKVVWTVHEWHNKECNEKNNISPIQAAILGRFIHGFITHCDTTKNEIVTAFKLKNEDKVFVVPHGNYIGIYENQVSQLEARKMLGIPPKNLVFLIFGGIYRYKGVLETIDAFKQLQQSEISLLIVGQPYENQLGEIIVEKIQACKNILFFPKRIPDDEIQIYMNACDALVVPYKVFTTSGVALLGMSYGRACIAPKAGFFKDILDESGAFLYDSHEEGLVQVMKSAIAKKDKLPEMGKYNLKVAEKWNWNYVSEQTLNVYQWCLGAEHTNPVKEANEHSSLLT